jgi:hypothetical protein
MSARDRVIAPLIKPSDSRIPIPFSYRYQTTPTLIRVLAPSDRRETVSKSSNQMADLSLA